MLLSQVALTSQQVAATQARRGKVSLLAACLAQLLPEEVPIGVAFLAGEPRQGRIGIGYAALRELSAPPAASSSLTLMHVDTALTRIAEVKGSGAVGERLRQLAALLAQSTALEQDFLHRLLLGELRQGALEGIMLDALAQAYAVSPAGLRRAFMLAGDLGRVAQAAREHGDAGLTEFRLQLMRPLQPMLAQSAADSGEALQKLGAAAFEYKLDGARVQVHREGDEVRVFTRALNDVTAAVPELVEAVRALPERALVLDGEAIALAKDGRPLPFQTTMRRFGRKLDVAALRAELPLSPFFFDVLHAGGQDLIDQPAQERARVLAQLVPAELGVPRAEITEAAQADAFLARSIATGHEGVVAKALAASYEAGRRGGSWLKIKRAHTLDLVVLAAEWGSGRRKGFLSNLHLGARGMQGELVMLGKTFKGMTDELLAWQTRELLAREVARDAFTIYVRPELVVEVAFDGVQKSPHYPGGVALRFARIKGYRRDKRVQDADTIETVRAFAALEPG
jgi:DNA ligase-1